MNETDAKSSHLICALAVFRAQYENELLRQQFVALTQEIERLKGDAPKPEGGLHVVPDPA